MTMMLRSGFYRALRAAERVTRPAPAALPADLSRIRRLLFLQYETALGTAVNATPVFEAVKRGRPEASIAVACHPLTCELLKYNEFIDDLILTTHPDRGFLRAGCELALGTRKLGHPFDCALTDAGNQKSRLALMMLGVRTKLRMGFTNAKELYHLALGYDRRQSALQNNLRLLDLLELGKADVRPRAFFSSRELEVAIELLAKNGLLNDRPIAVLVTQASGGQPSRWFDQRFVDVADSIAESLRAHVLFVGTASEAVAIGAIQSRMKNPSVSLAGQTNITELAALLCHCDLAVSLDTGPMHVARAVELPMVVIASAWQPAHEWLPLGVEAITILRHEDAACRACTISCCPTRACMKRIGVDEVTDAVETLIARYPASQASRQRRISNNLSKKFPMIVR
jgi:ADP-heptose:LPS heptosyltransferase